MNRGRILLLTGIPGVGKTTVICKVAESLSTSRLGGFYTIEIRRKGERLGFRAVTFDGGEKVIAHVDFHGPHRVSKYGVDVEAIDAIAETSLSLKKPVDVYLVDEIGKMECMSQSFIRRICSVLDSGKPVIAAISKKGHNFISQVKRRDDVELWDITGENRDEMPEKVLSWLRGFIESNI